MRAQPVSPLGDPILDNDWHVVAQRSQLRAGEAIAVRLLGVDLVLWDDGEEVHVWQDLCVHRGAKLSPGRVVDGCLICPYHGWSFDGSGQCVRFPAHPEQKPPERAHALVYPVRIRYDLVWVCLGTPMADVPLFAEGDDPAYRKVMAGPYRMKAKGPRIIENFLDVGHLPFVHAGTLGDPSYPEIEDYEAKLTDEGVSARDILIWQPNPDGSGAPGKVSYTYQVLRPLTAVFVKAQGEQRFLIIDIVTPVDENESLVWALMALNYPSELSDQELRDYQDGVVAQDIPVVESQRPELLPLDLQSELHLRSDRTAIAYRRWLRQLGVTYGTAS